MNFNAIKGRAKNIITQPLQEWAKIQNETTNKTELVTNYALPLILLGAASMFIGNSIFNANHSIAFGFASAFVYIITMVVCLIIASNVINELAPNFGSEKNTEAAYKLVVYSFTASFVGFIISNLHHGLSVLSVFGFYSFYLLWTGISIFMKTPEDKKVGYIVISFLVIILAYSFVNYILSLIMLSPFLVPSIN